MNGARDGSRLIRFGEFEADPRARELRRAGRKLKLQEKPFQILELLLERPGEVITRKELRERLWPSDVFVRFDGSLNTAINTLRRALGDSADNPRFVETRARRGYRFIAPLGRPDPAASRAPKATEDVRSVAVLPFENVGGDPEMEYLSDGVTESLIDCLSRLPGVRVMAQSAVFRYKATGIDPQALGRELHVQAVLTGRVRERTDAVVIAVELMDVHNGWRIWGNQYWRRFSDISAMQQEISKDISDNLHLRLTRKEHHQLIALRAENADAYRDYLKGRYQLNKMTEAGLSEGIAYFERAIQKDPNFGLAYAGLADCYALLAYFSLLPAKEVVPKAKEAALKALEIDESLAEAHASLAGVRKAYDWEWTAAEREYKRALELNPNYATAHRWYAAYLSAVGRPEEAIAEIQRAQELDPLSLIINMELGWNFYMAREYHRAIEESVATLEMEAQFAPAYHTLGLAYQQTGKHEEAIQAFQKAREISGGNPATLAGLGNAYAVASRRSDALKCLGNLKELSRRGYVPPYLSAVVYAGLGEKDLGFECLEQAFEERDVWLVWLKVEPRFDSLRSDTRFEALLQRISFPA